MARLGFRDYVSKEDIDEALRLMDKCRSSIIEETTKEGGKHFTVNNRAKKDGYYFGYI